MKEKEQKMQAGSTRKWTLLTIAFMEGGAVMAAELLGAKMLAPFFGTTIYAWAAVLAVTLLALASGYYIGGWLTKRHKSLNLLSIVLVLSGLFLVAMPSLSMLIMKGLVHTSLLTGLVISLMVFVYPPVLFFGMVSPVIVHTLINHISDAGSTAGKVYAISTVGGVISTLLLGFYVIPTFGIKGPSMIYGLLIMVLPLLLIPMKRKTLPVISLIIIAFLLVSFQLGETRKSSQRFHILYASEGIMGQVKVVDIKGLQLNGVPMEPRGLIVNNTWQTLYNRSDKTNLLDYVYFIKPVLSGIHTKNRQALLVGLGGGMLAQEMQREGFQTEVVEIDGRLKKLADRYFDLDPSIPVIIDDGRHFINQTKKKYGVVVLDAFLGENAPWHLLTKECFTAIHHKLEDDGTMIIEFFGHTTGSMGRPARSVLKTLRQSGFYVEMVATRRKETHDRNLIFIASKEKFNFNNLSYTTNPYALEPITNLSDFIVKISGDDMKDAMLLTDNHPALDLMLGRASLQWRNDLNGVLRDLLVEDGLPLFY